MCVCALGSYKMETLVLAAGCVSGEILWRYSISSGHLFAFSCARFLLEYLGSVCSCALIFGGVSFITLLFVHVCKWGVALNYFCVYEIHVFQIFTVCKVVVSLFVVEFVLWNMVCFILLGWCGCNASWCRKQKLIIGKKSKECGVGSRLKTSKLGETFCTATSALPGPLERRPQ